MSKADKVEVVTEKVSASEISLSSKDSSKSVWERGARVVIGLVGLGIVVGAGIAIFALGVSTGYGTIEKIANYFNN